MAILFILFFMFAIWCVINLSIAVLIFIDIFKKGVVFMPGPTTGEITASDHSVAGPSGLAPLLIGMMMLTTITLFGLVLLTESIYRRYCNVTARRLWHDGDVMNVDEQRPLKV